jgi:ATP-binding cassette subfamily B protein
MSTVQLFRRERRSFEAFDKTNRGHRDANVDSIYYYAVFYPAIEVIGAISTAMIIWFGGRWVLEGTLTLGSFLAFLLYSQRFYRPISDLSEKFNILQAAMASSERIFKLLDTEPKITSPPPRTAHRPPPTAHIVFDHVSFAYNADDLVLKNVSFEVRPGERVGIVGATGAGKSTIINLLLRFYDVTSGRILVDGVDVRTMDLAELRGLFSLVLQDVHLFSGTIASNIRLGESRISDDEVQRAARAVHAAPFVEQLPSGYETAVAERGATLSVGQKQLLSFARALAFDPRILVLDEATSSVDTETELLIRDALRALMAGRTTIAIAHRLSTIQDMDKILVLHHGQLRESGTHQELLARRGIYYKLFELQYREELASTPNSKLQTPKELTTTD